MRQSVFTRIIILGLATLAAMIYLMPTFVSPLPDWWTSILPEDKIHLGLDLQGGSHLVLEVKVDKAVAKQSFSCAAWIRCNSSISFRAVNSRRPCTGPP